VRCDLKKSVENGNSDKYVNPAMKSDRWLYSVFYKQRDNISMRSVASTRVTLRAKDSLPFRTGDQQVLAPLPSCPPFSRSYFWTIPPLPFSRRNQKAFAVRHKCLSDFEAANVSQEIVVFEAAQASKPHPSTPKIPPIPISIHSDLNFDHTGANEPAAPV
jgi:hypothetical protein